MDEVKERKRGRGVGMERGVRERQVKGEEERYERKGGIVV